MQQTEQTEQAERAEKAGYSQISACEERPPLGGYIQTPFAYRRFRSREVRVGDVVVGGDQPIRLQSMTISDTMDTAAVVEEAIALWRAGSEMVRITAPGPRDAENLGVIKREIQKRGYKIPLIADIHYSPRAAMIAIEHVEKVRINPGNFADRKRFQVREYTDIQYQEELERVQAIFVPLARRARELGRALRIGTNHGSLSDRIMNRFGDTPLGMVESAVEFLRFAALEGFYDIIVSMKASNPQVMVQAYRLLIERFYAEGMDYPLHLGVTEAGLGTEGRVKSALGIGALLNDGLGDTIRVSLTEDAVRELPAARKIAEPYQRIATAPVKELPQLCHENRGHENRGQEIEGQERELVICYREQADPYSYRRLLTKGVGVAAGEEQSISLGGRNGHLVFSAPPSAAGFPLESWQSALKLMQEQGVDCFWVTGREYEQYAPRQKRLLGETVRWVYDVGELRAVEQLRSALGTSASALALRIGIGSANGHSDTGQIGIIENALAESAFVNSMDAGNGLMESASGREGRAFGKAFFIDLALFPDIDLQTEGPGYFRKHLIGHFARHGSLYRRLSGTGGVVFSISLLPSSAALPPISEETDSGEGQGDMRFQITHAYRLLAALLRQQAGIEGGIAGPGSGAGSGLGSAAPSALAASIEAPAPLSIPPLLLRASLREWEAAIYQAPATMGALLLDGIGDAILLEGSSNSSRLASSRLAALSLDILQAARLRLSKTEFISCPSCGRTLFDLQETTARIQAATGHLKGVKIAVMGCIVNGPGEMADADFGYVGAGPGRIHLYRQKELVKANVPAQEADRELVKLIREQGMWIEA